MGLKRKGRAATVIVRGTAAEKGERGTGAAPTICSSHHHHRRRPDGNLIAAVGVTGLCVIEMKRRATPLERNYYYHLCVYEYEYEYEYVVCSCHNHQKPHRSRSGAKARPAGAISHQPSGIAIVFPLCAAWRGLVWFCFLPLVFYSSPYVVCNFVCWLHSFPHECATDLAHTPQRGGKCSLPGGRGVKRNDKNRKASLKNIYLKMVKTTANIC